MNHPYKAFENTEQWKIIRQAIEELIENDDLELHTPIEYVVGAICQELASDETSAQMKEKYKTSSMKIRR